MDEEDKELEKELEDFDLFDNKEAAAAAAATGLGGSGRGVAVNVAPRANPLGTTQSSPSLISPRSRPRGQTAGAQNGGRQSSSNVGLSPRNARLQLGPGGLGITQSSPRLRTASAGSQDLLLTPRMPLSPRATLLSPSGSVRSLGSKSLSQNRFILPDEEERLRIKGEHERIRSCARERREQLREAQKLQAESEHLALLHRKAAEREALKEILEAERFEKKRERLEKRDLSRASLWEKSPKVSDVAANVRPQSPRDSLRGQPPLSSPRLMSPRGGQRSPRMRPPLPPQDAQQVILTPREAHMASSSSSVPLMSPRERLGSWDMNIGTYSREEVHQLEQERLRVQREKELRYQKERQAREQERVRLEQRKEQIQLERTAELESVRLSKEQKRQQELLKRMKEQEIRDQKAERRTRERSVRAEQERNQGILQHQARERKVYMKQQMEEEARIQKLRETGQKEIQVQELRERHEREREQRKKQQMMEHAAKEREVQLIRDAREAAQEELRRRKIVELEERRAKVLAVKAEQDERKRRIEEDKFYIYTPAPRMSNAVKAAAAEAAAAAVAMHGSTASLASLVSKGQQAVIYAEQLQDQTYLRGVPQAAGAGGRGGRTAAAAPGSNLDIEDEELDKELEDFDLFDNKVALPRPMAAG